MTDDHNNPTDKIKLPKFVHYFRHTSVDLRYEITFGIAFCQCHRLPRLMLIFVDLDEPDFKIVNEISTMRGSWFSRLNLMLTSLSLQITSGKRSGEPFKVLQRLDAVRDDFNKHADTAVREYFCNAILAN